MALDICPRYLTLDGFYSVPIYGTILADFLAAHPIPDDSPLATDLPDEEVMQIEIKRGWKMYFDWASRSPDGQKQEKRKEKEKEKRFFFLFSILSYF